MSGNASKVAEASLEQGLLFPGGQPRRASWVGQRSSVAVEVVLTGRRWYRTRSQDLFAGLAGGVVGSGVAA